MEKTLLLSQEMVMNLTNMKEIVHLCDLTFRGMGEGTVVNPTKVNLDLGETASYPDYGGFMNAMPAYVGFQDIAGIKWAGGNVKERRKLGLPYVTAMAMLIDPKVGNFVAVMDSAFITNMRTGAQTSASLKYFLPSKKSIKLGLYGAGMQGHTQTMAIAENFDITEVRVYDLYRAASEKYKADMKNLVKGEIVICDDPKSVCDGVDAIVCVTQSKDALVMDEWVKPGQIVFPMGSYQEADEKLLLSADKIVVDHIGQCMHRGALAIATEKGKITEKNIYATIGEIAIGKKSMGDISKQRIVCIPIGTGAMDIAVAAEVYKKAKAQGIGESFAFV